MDFTTNLIAAGNQTVNVISTLMGLAFAASVLTAFLHIVFDLPLYNTLFGKGNLQADGKYDWQSKFFPSCDPRQYIAMGVGILAAYLIGLQMWASGLSIETAKMTAAAVTFDRISTGIAISAGCKFVLYFAKEYQASRAAIKKIGAAG